MPSRILLAHEVHVGYHCRPLTCNPAPHGTSVQSQWGETNRGATPKEVLQHISRLRCLRPMWNAGVTCELLRTCPCATSHAALAGDDREEHKSTNRREELINRSVGVIIAGHLRMPASRP